MKRKIVTIDENLCDGCGNCVTACSEGALKITNGKATLVKEDFCDGFGDCIGECPTGALKIEERDSKPFDINATKDHLLKTQGKEAVLRMQETQKKHEPSVHKTMPCGCPGSMIKMIQRDNLYTDTAQAVSSQLRNWPVQIHLLPIEAPYYHGADLLVAADCGAYAYGDFHKDFIKGHVLAIGCPKLDDADAYREKLAAILNENDIRSVTVAYMEVPCCKGLVEIVEEAVKKSGKKIDVQKTKIGIKGQAINP